MSKHRFTVALDDDDHQEWLEYIANSSVSDKNDLARKAVKEYISPDDDLQQTTDDLQKITPDDLLDLREELADTRRLVQEVRDHQISPDDLEYIVEQGALTAIFERERRARSGEDTFRSAADLDKEGRDE